MSDALTLSCLGLPCPQPVLKCKQCLASQAPTSLRVLVDNGAALQNVARFLASQGFAVSSEADGAVFVVHATRPEAQATACRVESDPGAMARKTVVFITSDTIGRGDDALGAKLMLNFLSTLPELGSALWRVVLVNNGVRLAIAGQSCLEKLNALSTLGVQILVCGTCLSHFGLLEQKQVGETTNMLDVVTSLDLASKVIQV
jgi:selenium metabolism protein YedF